MSEVKEPCLFDNSKECPVRTAGFPYKKGEVPLYTHLLEKACPQCPKRIRMIPAAKTK